MSRTIIPAERDAVYISGNMISLCSFATIEANTPAEAWPLRPPSKLDLSWLKLCDGKHIVTQLTDPLRKEGCFHDSATAIYDAFTFMKKTLATTAPSFNSLPDGFYELFELSMGRVGSPYYDAVVALSEVLQLEFCEQNYLLHISFLGVLDDGFRTLLRQRDERAILLLLYWYAKICDQRLWWLWKQAWTEGLAICEFLERAWMEKPELRELLVWPLARLTAASSGRAV